MLVTSSTAAGSLSQQVTHSHRARAPNVIAGGAVRVAV
jgi:hypothetical protein